jgi:hypothetical protein
MLYSPYLDGAMPVFASTSMGFIVYEILTISSSLGLNMSSGHFATSYRSSSTGLAEVARQGHFALIVALGRV